MSTLSQDRVRTSEETLRRLLKSWRSRYRSIILLKSQTPRVLVFQTEWARRPTPHEPLPDIRVHVDFSFLFDTTYDETGAKVPLPPSLTYRIEEEELVHRDLTNNIDHHILRHIKFKTEFARRNPLPLTVDQSEYFASRFAYEPLDVIADTHLDSFVDFADQAANDVRGVEKNLIDMFQRADNDRNGSLDPEEFEDLLLNSKWGFTKEDVAVVMAQHDANDDGQLVYTEFIIFAIDLVQAQRASAYAQTMTTNVTDAAYRSALARIQQSNDLHRCMDSGLSQLDPSDTGSVAIADLVQLLAGMDLDLDDGEIHAIIMRIKAINKAAAAANGESSAGGSGISSGAGTPSRPRQQISYRALQNNYEDILLECIQTYNLDKEASPIETYLTALFKKQDPQNTGILDERTLTEVLTNAGGGIELSSTQIYAIVGDHKPIDGQFKYRSFARKAAFMIHQLFADSSVSERTAMIKRSSITPIQLLSHASRARIESQMRSKFVEFDTDNDGLLSPEEFAKCMADTNLILSRTEIAQLRDRADTNKDGMVDMEEFMKFAYETLLHLQRDAALKTQMSAALKQNSLLQADAANGDAALGHE